MEQRQSMPDPLMGVLKPDDYLLRRYQDRQGRQADIFVAYYRVQRAGETIHSPKNCLPGWGWQPVQNDVVKMQQDGQTVEVNRYVVEKNGQRALVLYWYQAHGRIIASEYAGKLYLVWDALRYGRRDGGLVRVESI
jgi:EpsI family protein